MSTHGCLVDYYVSMKRSLTLLSALACALGVYAQTPSAAPTTESAPTPSALTGDLFYQILLGELSAIATDAGQAFAMMLDAARKTNDAQLYQRTVEIAFQARAGDLALQAARVWRQAQPSSRDANARVLQILIALNRVNESADALRIDISLAEPKERESALAAAPQFYARVADRKLAAKVFEDGVANYLTGRNASPSAWTSVGRMRLVAGDTEGAWDATRRAASLDSSAETPIHLALELMSPKLPAAEALVRRHLEAHPASDIRMGYARALLDAQRHAESVAQLVQLTVHQPSRAQTWLALGALQVQENQFTPAEASLKRYLELTQTETASEDRTRGLSQAYISLAQIAESRKDFVGAEAWLSKIENPQDLVSAQLRRASILARQGKLDDARALVRSLPGQSPAQVRMKVNAEVQLLRDNKQYRAAYDLISEVANVQPDDTDLAYERAMLAEKLGAVAEMERLLTQVIAARPDFPHAYNALGYSWADRNVRLNEAKQLIVKALDLAPNDPFITDSMGWVEFRLGNKAEALRLLNVAYSSRPDAEIAAHLGEVLWSMGQPDKARSVWREGLSLNAENETLLETLKRFRVTP